MLPIYKSRRKARRFLFYSLLVLGFLLIWCTLTIAILFLQDTEKSRNFTDDELNANNYSPLPGWGEGGRPVKLSKEEELLADESFMINQFNLYASDRISINRSIPDIRKQSCREKKYPDLHRITAPSSLPTTSIIIVYHNEAYSSLLRTITSIISRSPHKVLQEIILVDDFSTRTFLKYPNLDESLKHLPVTVKIIRANERVGLIRARMMGAQQASKELLILSISITYCLKSMINGDEATGDVLTFLDSHCECTTGWLEPLLARIKENRKNVVCPVIDVINDHTFQYQKGIELFRGGFNWNMQFRWYSMPSHMAKFKLQNPTNPIESPTMAGGLFSIDRKYFEELGAYDPGMDIWGGENLEISFRVLNANLLRVAEVWMDDWKYLFYKVAPREFLLSFRFFFFFF
uniref:Glyco_trans_2-like domain-containing protein n=1 Tax=Heterorhabditis bacteriophora TaxID=37862 RepID=A0A1I7XB06_HETBA